MKDANAPMTLEDIAVLLTEASRISNHRHFVIAGSLSAVGAVVNAPLSMVMSRDVDLYPKFDPGRGFVEIASQLSEGTDFALAHGFYADPITPALLTLPRGWEPRLLQMPLGNGVVAWFLDPNDAAVSKLVRGHENDVRWVTAAVAEGIVDPEAVLERLPNSSASMEEAAIAKEALARCISVGEVRRDGSSPGSA